MNNEGRNSAEYKDNRFMIMPDKSILSNMLFITDQYIARKLVGGFQLTEMINQLLNTGRIEDELLYPFEDVTWDTVFGNLKCLEFYNFGSSPETASGVGPYINFLNYIHDADTSNLIKDGCEDAKEICGLMLSKVWVDVKAELIESLQNKSFDRNELLNNALSIMMNSLYAAINEYTSEGYFDEEGNRIYVNVLTGMKSIFEEKEFDEKTLVKTTYASIVKGTEVLICNPEYLPFGERLASASKYFLAGGSILVGDKIMSELGDDLDKLRAKYGDEIVALLPALISATISCACIVAVDHNPIIQELVSRFNEVPTLTYEIRQLRESAEQFERIAAELGSYDFEQFKKEVEVYSNLANHIEKIDSPEELNKYLMDYYERTGKQIPWGNRTVEEHWADPTSTLIFN